jgi:adenine-specific DNA-methyltransferase
MPNKQKLELTWIGKDEELKLEPRILIEDSKKFRRWSWVNANSARTIMT